MLVHPPALGAGFSLPASDGAFVEIEGCDNSLQWATVGKQRHDYNHQPLRLVPPVEGGVGGLGEGAPTALALVAALLLGVDHDVSFAGTAVGAAASVVAPSLVRVHADSPR